MSVVPQSAVDLMPVLTTVASGAVTGLIPICIRLWADVRDLKQQVQDLKSDSYNQERDLQTMRSDISGIKADVSWIRQALSKSTPS